MPAIEYKAYYDIRFEKNPQLKKILSALEIAVEVGKSCRASCTMAEFCAAQPTVEGNKEKAARYYALAAE